MKPAKFKTAHITYPHPFQGRFVVRMLVLAMIDLYTKLEISMNTHYEDIKGDKKCRNLGGLGGYGSPNVIGNIIIR